LHERVVIIRKGSDTIILAALSLSKQLYSGCRMGIHCLITVRISVTVAQFTVPVATQYFPTID
jgi:hypothetical protein